MFSKKCVANDLLFMSIQISNFLTIHFYLNCSKVLEDHRETCQREGKYVEAEMAKNRI
jgi:hypothetical protein